jgi:hypothetical protein
MLNIRIVPSFDSCSLTRHEVNYRAAWQDDQAPRKKTTLDVGEEIRFVVPWCLGVWRSEKYKMTRK